MVINPAAQVYSVMENVLSAVDPTLEPDVDKIGRCRTVRLISQQRACAAPTKRVDGRYQIVRIVQQISVNKSV